MKITVVRALKTIGINAEPFCKCLVSNSRYILQEGGATDFIGCITNNEYIGSLDEKRKKIWLKDNSLIVEKTVEPILYKAMINVEFDYQIGYGFHYNFGQGTFKKGNTYELLKREEYFPLYLHGTLPHCTFGLAFIDSLLKSGSLLRCS